MYAHYPRIYAMLKRMGHDPAKAETILLDATRGDPWSLGWVKAMFKMRGW